jgi:heptosyltransferase-2
MTVQRFVSLGLENNTPLPDPLPIPSLVTNKQQAHLVLKKLDIPTLESPILGLCPGAEYGEAKRWPAENYAEVANASIAKGWQVWLFGSDKDIPVTNQINQLTQNQCMNLGGKTKLGEAIDVMALCHTVVSNDSGLMHVAAALDKKLVAIFGSSDPYHTPPMHPDAVIEYLKLDCSPCFKRECPLGHLNCLNNIKPNQVLEHFIATNTISR